MDTITAAFIAALIAVETGGHPDPNNAVGDKGRAVGCLQIWVAVLADVNKVSPVKYSQDDRRDPEKSKQICRIYLSIYATKERIGREPTDEDRARIWNGGPSGWKLKSTKPYWEKVKKQLEKKEDKK